MIRLLPKIAGVVLPSILPLIAMVGPVAAADLDYAYPPPQAYERPYVERPYVERAPLVEERPVIVEQPRVVIEEPAPYPPPFYGRPFYHRPFYHRPFYARPFYGPHPYFARRPPPSYGWARPYAGGPYGGPGYGPY